MSAYLQIRGVSKQFGRSLALESIDLDLQKGELVCFLGPSGCGKTTLLRILAGLEIPDTGSVVQAGVDVTRHSPAQRDFGIVFQSYALFPNLTAAANVAYGLRNTGRSRTAIEDRVRELLELVHLPDVGNRYPSQLSGGQQQRVAIARALALSPSLLLLDEPLSALDARVRADLRDEIRGLQRRLGITAILVTHDQEEALAIADRIVVLENGRIAQVGTPLEIYRKPASRFVAGFVGMMNFLPNGTAIRPEDIEVVGADPEGVPVEESSFLGSFYRLRLQLADGTACWADVPAARSREEALEPGARVRIRLPPDRLLRYV